MTLMVPLRPIPAAARCLRDRLATRRVSAVRSVQRSYATPSPAQETRPGAAVPPGATASLHQRKEALRNAKPFSEFLTDSFHREHDYLRISITERCNLRCLYCMPEEGVPLSPPEHMLTTPEIFYLSSLFVSQGVTKIRLTGGEPTVRRDIVPLMQSIGSLRAQGLRELALTTNGISLHRKLDAMVEAGLTGVNLSLDTLDPFQFQIMTRRNGFDAVMRSIERILEMNKLGANVKLKVNCVVMRGLNERDIIPFVELGREKDIEVRFIEYMPFGGNKWSEGKMISFQEMLDIIRVKYPGLHSVKGHKNDTSKTFQVPGFVGKVGFISSMTNDFCGTCNRLRITSDGNLKVCLHGNDEVSLRDILRKDNNGQPIDQEAFERIKQIEMDRRDGLLSDETILGWGQRERELLHVIGAAVKRKAEKHADMGDLKNMTNRPMILIGQSGPPSQVHTNLVDNSRSEFRAQGAYISGAGLVRQWSSIPPPRLSHPLLSLQAGRSHIHTFDTHASRGIHTKPKKGRGLSKPILERRPLDEEWELFEERRRGSERTMLQALSGSQTEGRELMERQEMLGPQYDAYWKLIEHIGRSYLPWYDKYYSTEDTRRVVEELQKIHIDMDEMTAQRQVCSNISNSLGRSVEPTELFPNHLGTEASVHVSVQAKAVQDKIKDLEWRLELAKEQPPQHDPGDFIAWREKIVARFEGRVNRKTSRAMWRRNKKIAAVALKGEERRKQLEHAWKAEIHELEQTLHTFKSHLELLAPNSLKTVQQLQAKQLQLDDEGKKLSADELEIAATRNARMEKRYGERTEKRAKEAEKKDQVRLEAGHAKVKWDGSLAATWRRDRAAAEKAAPEGFTPLEVAFPAQDSTATQSTATQSTASQADAFEYLSPERTKEQQPKSESEPKVDENASRNVQPVAQKAPDKLFVKIFGKDGKKKPKGIMKRLLDRGKMFDEDQDEFSIQDLRPRAQRAVGMVAGKDDTQANSLEKSVGYDGTRVEASRDESVSRNLEPVARGIQKLPKSIKQNVEYTDTRVAESRDESASRNLEPVAHESQSIQDELTHIIPDRRDPIAETRQQQLRDIHQSIEHLKRMASGAQSDGRLRVATARKLEEVLRELEKEAATVEDDQALHPFIRKSNMNPDLKYVRLDREMNVKHVQLSREQIAEQQQAANVFGESNKPPPIHAWPKPPPEALLPRSLSDQLKAQLSASEKIVIDDDLTVDVEADVPELQNHVFELSQKLKGSYPLMDTLPYDVWKSQQRKTLQTWLKILIWKWQTRNDEMNAESAEADPDVSQDVRALLDQMVLDHDLGQGAATRMAKRWAEIFVRQEERKMNVDPENANVALDWADMDAGLGFLDDEGAAVDGEKGRVQGVAKEKGTLPLPQGLPFTNKGKGHRYRFEASNMWRSADTAGYHTLAFRRQYSTGEDPKVTKVRITTGDWRPRTTPVEKTTQTPETQTSHPGSSSSEHRVQTSLPHLTSSGAAHMVSVATKPHTPRTAVATGTVCFSNPTPLSLIHSASNKKGDVLSVSRIAGIMAAKHTPLLIPLCHPIALTHVGVTLHIILPCSATVQNDYKKDFGAIVVESKVQCTGQTGVEMEALTSVMGAALSVVDMCKAVDKDISIDNVRVVLKEGGRSGTWRKEGWVSRGEGD